MVPHYASNRPENLDVLGAPSREKLCEANVLNDQCSGKYVVL